MRFLASSLLCAFAVLWPGAAGSPLHSRPRETEATKAAALSAVAGLTVEPKAVFLSGVSAEQRIIVSAETGEGLLLDATALARFSSEDPRVVSVDRQGRLRAVGKGATYVRAAVGDREGAAFVVVRHGDERQRPFHFASDIAPIISHLGCNASNCHGTLTGQSGFKLSLFGYDPDADYAALVEAGEGRRVNRADPEKSLILMKPTFSVTHGGGHILDKTSREYATLRDWIARGAPLGESGGARLIRLDVYPKDQRYLTRKDQVQRLVVVGRYSDGTETDMTGLVRYSPDNPEVAKVSAEGVVSPLENGETAIMVRSLGAVSVARVAVVLRPPVEESPGIEKLNFIDDFIFGKLSRLRIVPSPVCSDSEFIRRASLDVLGTLPRAEEVRRFLADPRPDKRSRLIDDLLKRPEYADFWSLKWGDLLTNTPQFLYNATAYYQAWLREALSTNMPFDRFASELLTATGGTYEPLPTNFYSILKKPEEMATFTSQVFLGVSLECARCHDHPSENWRRDDFMGLAAFFPQVKFKSGPRNNERYLYVDPDLEFKHPDTKEPVRAKFPGGDWVLFEPGEDRRARLAEWLRSPSNPFFAKAASNRVWREFMGRGLVDPPDDFRVTNPPSHPDLLDRLAADFVDHGFDLRHLMRRIMNSRAYQLSSQPSSGNRGDKTGFSRYTMRRLSAEQLLDAISQVTEVPETFPFFHPGKRAVQLPDPLVDSYFLTIFDRASRENATCSRRQSASLTQSLHLVGGETLNGKIRDGRGVLSRLIAEGRSDDQILEHLFLSALSRYPARDESSAVLAAVRRSPDRRSGLEDALWALLNSKEFLYNH